VRPTLTLSKPTKETEERENMMTSNVISCIAAIAFAGLPLTVRGQAKAETDQQAGHAPHERERRRP
jgi:siroheme synthase